VPLPLSLIGPALATSGGLMRRRGQVPSGPEKLARALAERAVLLARCERALDLLDEQRHAVLEGTIPRVEALWSRPADAGDAMRTAYEERLEGLGVQSPGAPGLRAEPAALVARVAGSSEPVEPSVALGSNLRLEAVIATSIRGLEALAHMRASLAAQCRRLEAHAIADPSVGAWPVQAQRMLAATGSLAGAAAALAFLPVVGRDGGVERRFAAALLQV
jgi:hypothetical protein